jgi:Protein of unknown function (DUF4038)
MQPLRVHPNQRFLATADGHPFFWLGDTAWELFHRLTRPEISHYLQTRTKQGFNLIQAVLLPELHGLTEANRLGQLPFLSLQTLEPNRAYFDFVEDVLQEAQGLGLYMALLPTWADKLTPDWGAGPVIFTLNNLEQAQQYGAYLGKRFAGFPNVVWMLGGDRPAIYSPQRKVQDRVEADSTDLRPIWRSLAQGIRDGGAAQLLTHHPDGGPLTARALHHESWHELTLFQSGHWQRFSPVWDWLEEHFLRQPLKPALDAEPCYEDHGVNPWHKDWTAAEGYFRADDVRLQIYRGIFAGGCGVTYGHQSVWQFVNPELYAPLAHPDVLLWRTALERPAALQMLYLRRLFESLPFAELRPDHTLLEPNTQAWALSNQSTALVYAQDSFVLRLNHFAQAQWFSPTTGAYRPAQAQQLKYTLPNGVFDAVLILSNETGNVIF